MSLPRRPAAVIFDMDGLLFDTEALHEEAAGLAARDVAHEMTPEIFRSLIGLPGPAGRSRVLQHFGPSFPIDIFFDAWRGHFYAMVDTRLVLKPGALELLDLLDTLGLPRAIATSSSHKTVQHHLSFHDLGARFHHVVAQGDYAAGKPAPDPYLTAAERLGVAPGLCLALEDSHNGVRSASAAGMMTIMVPDLLEATDEIKGLCAFVVRDLHAVHSLVLGCAR
ncbi:MAG: HAD family hydrolase [Alphaproteobacteria bacterium RIFCSPHIGHO2_12_FULL_66_14]|jgi:HAD superfamily hydrolase (TIGR01509 family)|nr:MAG: HAD family hydrolase [Alphaproteobacteria bacterium RIFCSPHIGHO2_12_FULL_66_14]